MTRKNSETRASIRALADTMHAETGRFVTLCEDMHADGVLAISVSIFDGVAFEWFRGSESPITDRETTLEQMRDDLAAWLVKSRKEAA